MKKDRNTFFSEYGFNGASGGMNPNMMMPGGNMPNVNYPGGMPGGMPGGVPGQMPNPMPTDVEARIAKLERSLNRLETRVSKLEGETVQAYDSDYNYNNSMYMV